MRKESKEVLRITINYETPYTKYMDGKKPYTKDVGVFSTFSLFTLGRKFIMLTESKWGEVNLFEKRNEKESIEDMLHVISSIFKHGVIDDIAEYETYTIIVFRTNYFKGNLRISFEKNKREEVLDKVIKILLYEGEEE